MTTQHRGGDPLVEKPNKLLLMWAVFHDCATYIPATWPKERK